MIGYSDLSFGVILLCCIAPFELYSQLSTSSLIANPFIDTTFVKHFSSVRKGFFLTLPRMLIFHCAAEINLPRNAAYWEIARIDQEEQFASRIPSRSQVINENEAKQEV